VQNYKFLAKEKLKKRTLKAEPEFQGKILAITASVPDYRLCHFINKQLGLEFRKWEKASANLTDEAQHEAPIHQTTLPESQQRLFLLPNKIKAEGQYLLPHFRQIDFIFVVEDHSGSTDTSSYLNQLKAIDMVQAAFEISHKQFKPENYLNLD